MSCSLHNKEMPTKKENTGLEVITASYGVAPNFQDVTEQVKNMVKDGDLNFTVSAQELGILDPAPGVTKTFQAKLTVNGGKPMILSKNDSEVFSVSAPPVDEPDEKPSLIGQLFTALYYGMAALIVMYIAKSTYYFGEQAFSSPGALPSSAASIFGMMMMGIVLTTYGGFGLFVVPLVVFAYCLYDPTGINWNWILPDKKVV
jgi:hypothetical protein